MRSARRRAVLALCVLSAGAWIVPAPAQEAASADLRVMSYNVRVGTAEDGDDDWDKRKDFLASTIRAFAPDFLGTQETLDFQRDYLASQLPGYDSVGLARDAAHDDGEMMAVFYRRERFEKLAEGHFWLSETPDVPGSSSWNSACPRMVTWVKLRDRRAPSAPPIVFLNTHFDHESAEARRQAARMIRERVDALVAQGDSVVLTGDFNSSDRDAPYSAVFAPGESGRASAVADTYRVLHPTPAAGEGTFSKFVATNRDGPRIDWIGVSREWHVAEAGIEHAARDGHTPSDHFGVTAVLRR